MEALFALLVGGWAVWSFIHENRKRGQRWKDAVASCGFEMVEAPGSFKARAGPVEVQLEGSGDKSRPTQIVVVAPAPPDFQKMVIRPQPALHWVREIEVGDESFDDMFIIDGPVQLVFALLDAETRRLLSNPRFEKQMKISYGEIRAVVTDEKVAEVLRLLLDVCKRFAPPIEVRRRLAENARQDPMPGVRLQNLLLLVRELPGDPATAEALRAACSDSSPEIRLRAAKELGAEGRDVLLELAQSLEVDTVSAEAVSILDRELPFERMTAILDGALSRRRHRTGLACLEAIGRSGATAAVGALSKVMAARESGELAPAAAEALGATGSPAAEPPLIQALQGDRGDLRVAAANALARVGSTAAVLPLKEAAERSLLDLELRRAARQSIAEIQSRVQGASPGQLSLAGTEAGQLSLSETEAGQLSLTEDPAGQLSLPPEERSPWPK